MILDEKDFLSVVRYEKNYRQAFVFIFVLFNIAQYDGFRII